MPRGARARAAEARRTRGCPRREAVKPGSEEPASCGARGPPWQKPRPRGEEAERESSKGLLYRTRRRPRREAVTPGSKGPASRGARGPARQKLRPRNEEAESESSGELSMKQAKASAARSRRASCRGARGPARQKPAGREGVRGEEPPGQARRSPSAAGREGPRAGQRNEGNPERGVRRGLDADRHETDDLLVRLSLKVPIDEVSIEVGAGLSEEVEGPRGLPAEAGPGNPEDATSPLKEPTSRGVRGPPRQKPRPRNEEAERESSQGLLYRTRSRPRR